MLEEKNVKFYMNDRVAEIRGENGKVTLLSAGFYHRRNHTGVILHIS